MKRISLSLLAILTIGLAYGQDQSVTYKITNYSVNGVNYDDLALNSDVAISFYMCDNTTMCFANLWRNTGSQSYGGVYALKSKEIPETPSTFGGEEYKFTWKFLNTYDDKKGEAAVTFTKSLIGNTVKIRAEILVLNTNEVLVLDGYQE